MKSAVIDAIYVVAGDVVDFRIFHPYDRAAILKPLLLGNPTSGRVWKPIVQAMAAVCAATELQPKLCVCCPGLVCRGDDYRIALAMPGGSEDSLPPVALVICPRSADSAATLKQKATEALRQIWPDIRNISPTHLHGGRA